MEAGFYQIRAINRDPLLSSPDEQCAIQFNSHQPHNTASLDPEYFSKVLDNLIQNACRYAKSSVEIRCDWLDRKLFILSIEDDGAGIPEDQRDSVFKPFIRLPQTSKEGSNHNHSENFGLGLAIVERVIHWHGGNISVHGRENGGSSFQVQWPIAHSAINGHTN